MRLLAEATDADQLRELLALPMLELMGADTYVSMVWNSQVERFERIKAVNMSPDNLRSWDEHFRFVDPLTFPMMERRAPTVATQILCQRDLSRTEFFNDFLLRDRMHWGVNVYFQEDGECIGDFRIWRQHKRGNFEAADLDILRLVEPAITAALSRLRAVSGGAAPRQVTGMVEELLQRRGRLSQREAQVAWLVSCGRTDKQIAQQLTLGFPTVRFHLANAFRKLQANNRTTLAARVQSLVDA